MPKILDHFLINQKSRTTNLEGIRALAIFLVFNVHAISFFLEKPFMKEAPVVDAVLRVFQAGHFGVDLFFVLSGYLIYRALPKATSVGGFMLKRYKRLWPVVFVTTFPEVIGRPAWQMFDNLSLLMLRTKNHENFVMWSLTYEIYFYFFLALWAVCLRRIHLFLYGALLIAMFAIVPGHFIREPYRFVAFFWGIFLALNEETIRARSGRALSTWAGPVALLALFAMQIWWGPLNLSSPLPESWRQPFYFMLAQPVFFVLVASLLEPSGPLTKIFSNPWVRAVGNISFSFYVIHNIWGLRLSQQMFQSMDDSFAKLFCVYVVGFALSLVFAAILFLWLEKPYFTGRRIFPLRTAQPTT